MWLDSLFSNALDLLSVIGIEARVKVRELGSKGVRIRVIGLGSEKYIESLQYRRKRRLYYF